MTAPKRGAIQPRSTVSTRSRKPAPEPVETLEQATARIAAAAPVLGGEKHDLIEVARAAGAYRKELMAQGFSQLEAMAMVTEWHGARWAIAQDEHGDAPDPESV